MLHIEKLAHKRNVHRVLAAIQNTFIIFRTILGVFQTTLAIIWTTCPDHKTLKEQVVPKASIPFFCVSEVGTGCNLDLKKTRSRLVDPAKNYPAGIISFKNYLQLTRLFSRNLAVGYFQRRGKRTTEQSKIRQSKTGGSIADCQTPYAN